MIRTPYLLFVGDESDARFTKTATGIQFWRRENCGGVYRFPGYKLDYGLPALDIAEAASAGIKTLIVGVAPPGGQIQPGWIGVFVEALHSGLDIAAGLHSRLNDVPELSETAQRTGRKLFDVRQPNKQYPVGTGRKRSGKRLLTVGTDCAVGKKFTALSIERELKARNLNCTFRATGQTGILIAGAGACVDAVVADFISGAAESLSPDNNADHWDVIEGQGSLFHPGYAGVSLGLLHGSQPDVIVVCHEAGRKNIVGIDGYPVPGLRQCIDRHLELGRLTNPAVSCAGVSINTSCMNEMCAATHLAEVSDRLDLPAVDPVRFGVGPIVDRLLQV